MTFKKPTPNYTPTFAYLIMGLSALIAATVSLQSPVLQHYTSLHNRNDTSCVIDDYVMGQDFDQVMKKYNSFLEVATTFCNLVLFRKIKQYRKTGEFTSIFCFFFLGVFPLRFVHLFVQIKEFDEIGGTHYSKYLSNPSLYPQCQFFPGRLDALLLMHFRLLFVTLEFVTLNLLVLTISIVYAYVKAHNHQ